MSARSVGVLALQGDVREHVLALERSAPRRCGYAPGRARRVDALVLPGGESTTMGNLAVRLGLLEPLRERVAAGMPAYGSCAGMIMLADRIEGGRADQQTIGGIDVVVRRNAFGRQVDSFEADLGDAGDRPGPFHAVFIRAPWVESVGPAVRGARHRGGRPRRR